MSREDWQEPAAIHEGLYTEHEQGHIYIEKSPVAVEDGEVARKLGSSPPLDPGTEVVAESRNIHRAHAAISQLKEDDQHKTLDSHWTERPRRDCRICKSFLRPW
jgi:hypothetical protein